MKSKANIKGHPIHQILVAFPIAFFTGVFIFDLLFLFTQKESFRQTALYLTEAGIVSSVITAIPGIIDYIFTIPPKSSAKKRGAKHGLINVSVVMIFTLSLLIRLYTHTNIFLSLSIEALGVILLSIAGWLGGTLVVRNQIGVDHRYANAGKWKEQRIRNSLNAIELKNLEELGINQMKLVVINDKRIVVTRTESEYIAFDDYCSHRGGSLADGVMICGTVQCPWHGSQFDAKTGNVKAGPAKEKINTYRIEVTDQKYILKL
jgi:uncharacterized membrane protein/nitrite reductase/ring-hydroxylating ferredoxin subunit